MEQTRMCTRTTMGMRVCRREVHALLGRRSRQQSLRVRSISIRINTCPEAAHYGPKSAKSDPRSVKCGPHGEAERCLAWNVH